MIINKILLKYYLSILLEYQNIVYAILTYHTLTSIYFDKLCNLIYLKTITTL